MFCYLPSSLRLRLHALTGNPNIAIARTTISRSYSTLKTPRRTQGGSSLSEDSTWAFFEPYNSSITQGTIKRSVDEIWESNSQLAREALARNPIANAYTGRSVKVINGNIADAFRRLDLCLSRNRVRYELRLAERHEKKGDKRRRLESERWRTRFANEVRKKVALVKAIRRRGA